jgi:hypothetical protein
LVKGVHYLFGGGHLSETAFQIVPEIAQVYFHWNARNKVSSASNVLPKVHIDAKSLAFVRCLMVVVPIDLSVVPLDVAGESLTVIVGGKSYASQWNKIGMRDCLPLGCWKEPFLVIEDYGGHQDCGSEGE